MKRLRKALTYLLQAVILGLLVWYFYQNRGVFGALRNIHWTQVAWIVLLDSASFVVASFLNYSMIRRLGHHVSFADNLMLQYANNFLNKILPTIGGGAAFRAIYLKKKYDFPYTQFTSALAGLYVITFASTSLIGIFCLWMIYRARGVFNWIIFLAFLGILIPSLLIMLFSPRIPESKNRILTILRNIVEGWKAIKRDPRFILLYTAISIVFLVLSAAQIYLGYVALGARAEFIPMLFLSTLGIIIAFLNFTPGGIGVKEGLYIFSTDLVRIPDEILVLGSFVMRGISLFTTFLIGGASYLALSRRIKRMGADEPTPAPAKKAAGS